MTKSASHRTQQQSGCGCLFGLIGALFNAIVQLLTVCINLTTQLISWLQAQTIVLPVKQGVRISGLAAVAGLCAFCCVCNYAYYSVDSGLRTAGILPTYTPRAVAMAPATRAVRNLSTPRPTPTERPTMTPLPTINSLNEETPTFTPEPSSVPTIVPTIAPQLVTSESPTEVPPAEPQSLPTWTPEPTAVPDPPTSTPVPTSVPTLEPTPTSGIEGPKVVIIGLDKRNEFVTIKNIGTQPQDLTGWRMRSERGNQDNCMLSGVLGPGETLTIYAQAGPGFSCGYDGPIWNNEERDPAVLIDAGGNEVFRWEDF